ncbi:hypothetical protein C5Y93_17255 [Blastopirellula marina]|uniref:HEAT repeat domain-containing protein n=2 Tax=Blastopirellula marina TaxID=124 RepID=A0A2S8GKJ8_9BACT|nr:hypothetical protein C5Y93_17255 [Blastopirellula marina]
MGLWTLLYLVMVIALGLGWYQDHQRLEDAQAQMPLEIRLQRDQLEAMQGWVEVEISNINGAYLSSFDSSGGLEYKGYHQKPRLVHGAFPWNAKQYLESLDAIPNGELREIVPPDQQMQSFATLLQFAPDHVFREVMPKVLAYFDSPEADNRRGLVAGMRWLLMDSPDRIAPYRASVLANIVECLDDSDPKVIYEAILAVGEVGPEARAAAPRLQTLAEEEQNWHALKALYQIEPSPENFQRIEAWIFERKPDWEFLAVNLKELMTPEEGIELLRRAYSKSVFPADQKILASRINLLEVHRLAELNKQTASAGKEEQR